MLRDRLIDAIRHKPTDMVPWNIEVTAAFAQALKDQTGAEDVDAYLENHLTRLKYKSEVALGNGLKRDIFGAVWKEARDGGDIGVVAEYPLAEPSLEGYEMPEIQRGLVDSLCDGARERSGRGEFIAFSLTMGYFERAWSLRGMENILMDMLLEQEFCQELFDGILEHHLALLDYALEKDIDGIYIGDDWGQQKGLIMGPAMWRKYIKPGMTQIYAKIKCKGKYIIQHSCGDIREILPDLIDMGLDVYNTVQPEIYDLRALKREYGKDLTFYGGISTQQFLPFATPGEVAETTRRTLDVLYGGGGGGYILSPTHAVTRDIPIENVLAIVTTAREYGG